MVGGGGVTALEGSHGGKVIGIVGAFDTCGADVVDLVDEGAQFLVLVL